MMADAIPLPLRVGATYRGKKPRKYLDGSFNDRTILWVGQGRVQYDGPAVKDGSKYPSVTHAQFWAWADHEVLQ